MTARHESEKKGESRLTGLAVNFDNLLLFNSICETNLRLVCEPPGFKYLSGIFKSPITLSLRSVSSLSKLTSSDRQTELKILRLVL